MLPDGVSYGATGMKVLFIGNSFTARNDVPALVAALVDDYELTGDPTIRMLALEGRNDGLEPFLAAGRAHHREWCVEKLQAVDDVLALVVVATDVYTWKLRRRDGVLDRAGAEERMHRLVAALLTALPPDPKVR